MVGNGQTAHPASLKMHLCQDCYNMPLSFLLLVHSKLSAHVRSTLQKKAMHKHTHTHIYISGNFQLLRALSLVPRKLRRRMLSSHICGLHRPSTHCSRYEFWNMHHTFSLPFCSSHVYIPTQKSWSPVKLYTFILRSCSPVNTVHSDLSSHSEHFWHMRRCLSDFHTQEGSTHNAPGKVP